MIAALADHDRALVLIYAPADRRERLAALFALDEALGQIVRGARDPLLGQMRLTWWQEALSSLGKGPPPSDPVLVALAVPGMVPGPDLAVMIEGWEALMEDPVDIALFADQRGATLFRLAAKVLGGEHDAIDDAGAGWALVDLARHSSEPALADAAMAAARPHLDRAMALHWPVRLRALGALAALASRGATEQADHPARMLRALRHRLTGR